MTRHRVYRLKNLSVYVGLAGYAAMLISGEVVVGAWSKLIAEALGILLSLHRRQRHGGTVLVLYCRKRHRHRQQLPMNFAMLYIMPAVVGLMFVGIIFFLEGLSKNV